jgi:hypothetical protein
MSDFMLSQILIGFAFCFDVASFQFRDKQKVLICLAGASVLIALHFWLLQANTAAVITVIAALRFLSATFTRAIWLMFTFVGLIVSAAALTYAGLLTILVTVSSLLSTWGAFRASDRVFRLVMMTTALIMIVHNTLAQTPAGVLLEIFFLSSNLFAYYRYYLRR